MKKWMALAVAGIVSVCFCGYLGADTVELKNGRSIEGIVVEETGKVVVVDTGFGAVSLAAQQVEKITRSTPEERQALRNKWGRIAEDIEDDGNALSEERKKGIEEYFQSEKMRLKEIPRARADVVKLAKIEGSKDILVEAVLNENVKAALILDTGSPHIVLTRRIGDRLGIDLSDTRSNTREVRLTGARRLATTVILRSFQVGDVKAKDVLADILLEDVDVEGLKDGLLGMSFLNRYNCSIDLDSLEMSLTEKKI